MTKPPLPEAHQLMKVDSTELQAVLDNIPSVNNTSKTFYSLSWTYPLNHCSCLISSAIFDTNLGHVAETLDLTLDEIRLVGIESTWRAVA